VTRVIAEQSGVPSYKIRRGDINEDDFRRITDAARDMQSIPFYIDQSGGISIASINSARASIKQKGLDVLVVDCNLQLLAGSKVAER
jgi:replicative DNA helicase